MITSTSLVLLLLSHFLPSLAVELTFELAENSHQCFYEEADLGSSIILEYQVVDGGSYDVDVEVTGPGGQMLYKLERGQYDTSTLTAPENGTYRICFGNQFSTFSHKVIYMTFDVEPSTVSTEEHGDFMAPTAMTQMEASLQEIQDSLRSVVDHQTHHRLREAQSRRRAEDLSDRVLWWSLAETLAILFVSVSQVYIVRMFFAFRDPIPLSRT